MKRFYLTIVAIICTAVASMALATDAVTTSTSLNHQIIVKPSAFSAKNLAEPCGATKGAGSSLAFSSCGLTDNPSSTLFNNKSDTNLQIAPNCVEVCITYPDGRKARCFSRCAFGFWG